ncbi:MAG: caspase family protein [Proteobacteria bacterium]|nr:caspase family protein [Pseudomonadota bacterium]
MKIFGTFIGINKYISSDVSDLTGATRDAQALWALFNDTFPEIRSRLLLDSEASCANIRNGISDTLEVAESGDVAIVFFSGHGTRNHRLVAHDTVNDNNLNETTISMKFLADQFKESKAKVIICILDCCFSGGATAKVFSDTPSPRDVGDPFSEIRGKGRIFVAASSATQPAYEKPGSSHGLLTEAILKILKNNESQVNIATTIYDIIEIVQLEATRIGVEQTPVVASLIEGGLVFSFFSVWRKIFIALSR